MFRTLARTFLPNPFDSMLKKTAKRGGFRILICWNRGLGDIPLGLYAMVQRVREIIPHAEITFLTRENLKEGFSLLEGVSILIAPDWKRGSPISMKKSLKTLEIDPKSFDLMIEKASPTDWVRWQRGKVMPKLKWNPLYDPLYENFGIEKRNGSDTQPIMIGVQVSAETNYGLWRNWPIERWNELFERIQFKGKVILFGYGDVPKFTQENIIDLRGKTTLFQMLSIIKNCCHAMILPDSGILSMAYYLDEKFPIHLISLWADPNHGILKQAVGSPNPQLVHTPLIGEKRNLSTVSVDSVIDHLFPLAKVGAIILAGGQGTRLGFEGPKGLFKIGGKTLFEWLLHQVPSKELPIAIMTSPTNHEETISYFKANQFFGLQIYFFQQEMAPFLDEKKNEMNVKGPNGNGSVFRSFVKAGLGDLFAEKGVDVLSICYIENPLSNPFDLKLVKQLRETKSEVVVKCIAKEEADPMMGRLVKKGERIEIVEYTESDPNDHYQYVYSGQMAFDLTFFKMMAHKELPVHWVKKELTIDSKKIKVWKGEHFIFDCLPYAKRVCSLCAPRNGCYAPIKSMENIAAVETILGNR